MTATALDRAALDRLGPLAEGAAAVAADLLSRDAVRRIFANDHTLWRDDPTEISDRLGWMPVVSEVLDGLDELRARCDALLDGVDHVLVMGMGGSSLFPEVLARMFVDSSRRSGPTLHVLDTTDPVAIARVSAACPADRTLHLASSKSGSTIETRSHLEWAWQRSGDPARFAVVTDPGSELGALARERGFAEVFENRADIGGRYSALSFFGIVPALLAGVDAGELLRGGLDALAECGPNVDAAGNPALTLAAALAAGVRAGRDKATFVLHPAAASVGLWLEQLIAESLGKDGTGVVPIVGEPLGPPAVYGDDRLFVVDPSQLDSMADLIEAGHPVIALPNPLIAAIDRSAAASEGSSSAGADGGSAHQPVAASVGSNIGMPSTRALGHLVVAAELATALTAAAIGVQPFDQPDVAAAKAATNDVLASGDTGLSETPLADLLAQLRPGDHLAIQAFVDPGGEHAASLEAARSALREEHRVATSLGFGPRFLHSTGQLHKGGPESIVCVQVVDDDPVDIPIPGREFGFGELKQAQATGDLRILQARGVRAGRVPAGSLNAYARHARVSVHRSGDG
ncbi:MAG: glucose-6-phosphate isomerase [Actinomycetota bacterium]